MPRITSTVHPEYLAKAADEARQYSRFSVNPTSEPSEGKRDQVVRWQRADTRKYSADKVPKEFEIFMPPILAAAMTCRVFGMKPLLARAERPETAARRERWLDAYVDGRKDVVDVDMTVRGVRKDLEFWWWLAFSGAKPLITVKRKDVDPVELFGATDGPHVQTMRHELTQAMITFATKAAVGDSVCFFALATPKSIDIKVFASKDVIGPLAAAAFEHGALGEKERKEMAVFAPKVLHLWDASGAWTSVIRDKDPERVLLSLLRSGEKRAGDVQAAARGLTAAEAVAILERREPTGVEAHIIRDLRKWAPKQDRLELSTVELARRVVAAIQARPVIETEKFHSPEGRALWRAELDDLLKRLDAALLARRVQATAANAKPPAPSHVAPETLVRPERWATQYFYAVRDDAQALLDFVRDDTGGRLYVRTAGEEPELHELTASWDLREVLSAAFNGEFDARRIEHPIEVHQGLQVHVWWPDVSPPPELRRIVPDADEEAVDEAEDEEMAAELGMPAGIFARDEYEVAGWGIPAMLFCGAVDKQILPSALEYPTGGELKRPRYRGAGPWRDVDWTAFRRKVRALRGAIDGSLSGGRLIASKPIPLLDRAARHARDGWTLAGKNGRTAPEAIEWSGDS